MELLQAGVECSVIALWLGPACCTDIIEANQLLMIRTIRS
jgi:hypothetical protein